MPDEVYGEVAGHFDSPQLAALVVAITAINAWNRVILAGAPKRSASHEAWSRPVAA